MRPFRTACGAQRYRAKKRDLKKQVKRIAYLRQDDHYDEKMALIKKWKGRQITLEKVQKLGYMAAEVRGCARARRRRARARAHAKGETPRARASSIA